MPLYPVEEGLDYNQERAKQGNPVAQFNLGNCYENGLGVPRDLAKAAEWYQKAADQGHAEARYRFCIYCCDPNNTNANLSTGISFFLKAAEQGDPDAEVELKDLARQTLL